MITADQKKRIKALASAIVVAEVQKRATPRFSSERPQVQAKWHEAVDALDRYLDGLVKQ